MPRFIYIRLLRLHPRRFRERFGDEMLWIFDQTAETRRRLPLLADAVWSLWRQWALRPEFRAADRALAIQQAGGVPPLFYLSESEMPRRSALVHGALLSIGVFAALSFAITHSAGRRGILTGSHHPSHSHLLSVGTDADASAELPSEVRLKPDGAIHERDLVRRFAVGYFQGLPVLAALDANHDLTISAEEISRAAETLGKLSPKERGGGRRLMRLHPVLAALDANGNGEISAREIRNAPAALRKLDKNGDGKLTLDEILPDPVAYWAAVIRRPGMTEAELRKEIRRRADLDRDGAVTWEEILTAVQSGLLDLRK